jgi:hypothetical protein
MLLRERPNSFFLSDDILIGYNPYRWPNSLYLTYFSPTQMLIFPTQHWGGAFVAGGAMLAFLLRR